MEVFIKMRVLRYLVWVIVCWGPLTLCAQNLGLPEREQVDQVHAWYVWTGQYPIRGKWGLYTEYHFRRANLLSEFQQSLLRVGAEYKLSPQVSGIMGYGLIS